MSNSSDQPSKLLLFGALFAAALFMAAWIGDAPRWTGIGLVGCLSLLALYFRKHGTLHIFTFTLWVLAGTVAALFWPSLFVEWNGFRLNSLNLYLIQIIMFAMGASLSVKDFADAVKMPKAVLIGMFLQFSIMPCLGFAVAKAFGFEAEVAAGIILIGSCSGGVASNLMVFLSRGNVALSVTMTACSTLMAPFMTPLLMKVLAGQLIEINFWTMMLSIINLVIIPIGGGLIANKVLEYRRNGGEFFKVLTPLALMLGAGVAVASGIIMTLGGSVADTPFIMARVHQGLGLVALTFLIGWILNVSLAGHRAAFDRILPLVSMTAICIILTIIAANSRDELLNLGLLLLLAALIHNTAGYTLGYWMAGLARLPEADRRTVAFEVGMQNGGMAVGLALDVLKSTAAALGPAIFGTLMNITGSTLASWWRDQPTGDEVA